MESQTKINCPECSAEIDVNHVLAEGLEKKLKKELQKQHKSKVDELLEQIESLQKINASSDEELVRAKKEAYKAAKEDAEKKVREEFSEEKKVLNDELIKKSEQVKEYHKMKANLAKSEREKSELEDKLKAENETKLNEGITKAKIEAKKEAEAAQEIKLKERDELVDKLKAQINDLKQKAEQGSMQTQGEAQELAIEGWLKLNFRLDTIDEIKKGASGADCLQTVHTREVQNCGTIYYESKNTKNFSTAWVDKFKNDIKEKNANIGVLVTNVLPKELDRATMIDKNLWVCTYQEFKILAASLRQSIIAVNQMVSTQTNKGDKMELLYDYLTSNEFRLQLGAIKDAFDQMESDLQSEIRVTQTRWNKRRKQLDKVLGNVTGIYGSLRGIAGNSIPHIDDLEDEKLIEA